uniref:DNA methylase adenine-specific domain-containing protein n=1 Tax=candidate division CPR3 bacterium TaxID=2268181 RepID=A0A7V3N4D7_UNCC3
MNADSFYKHGSLEYEISLSPYIFRIKKATDSCRSEAKLEIELHQILRELLGEFGIKFDPYVDETLQNMGLAQINADRPDGVFGHIVYDYKSPNLLNKPKELLKAKEQIVKYLDGVTNGGHTNNPEECSKWIGYLWDGSSLFFCTSTGNSWSWSKRMLITESSLLFLIQVYRSLKRKPLTSKMLSQAFGKHSEVAIEVIRVMCSHLAKPKHRTNMLFREWKRLFQQVSTYGLEQLPSVKAWAIQNGIATKDSSHILFAMHSYYSLVVKILTSELLAATTAIPSTLCESLATAPSHEDLYKILVFLEDSEYYRRYRISNFLEGDFFSWYIHEESKPLAVAFKALAREFLDFEPATAILKPEAIKDLLKEFYTDLVDEQIRHDLGEYYTPDWLAQHLLDQVGYNGNTKQKVLDPACGSGTFLVECIIRLRAQCERENLSPLKTLETVLINIKGIDLNPLAVISARANYILSIADLVFALGHDVEIPVYLADCINVPIEKEDDDGNAYLEYFLDTEVELFILQIPLSLVKSRVLEKVLLKCEECVAQNKDFTFFKKVLEGDDSVKIHLTQYVINKLEEFYNIISSLHKREWNKIWCRILKNNFIPKSFGKIDLIVGNPPWVRWSRLPETYRKRVKSFCLYYGLVSGKGYSGGIESDISTVVAFSSVDHWLKLAGKIAFLITWTVFKSGSARGFRLGALPDGTGLRILHIEDLTALQPFPDATNETSIYIAEKVENASDAEFTEIPCKIWHPKGSGRVHPALSLTRAYELTQIVDGSACPVGAWGSPFFTGDREHYDHSYFLKGHSSYYLNLAHRGTNSDFSRIYWVKVEKYSKSSGRALIRTLTEEELPGAQLIDSVEGAWIEAELLYPLIRGRDLGRFSYRTNGWYQIIPNLHYNDVESEDDFANKYPLAYSYFSNYDKLLKKRSSYKRYQQDLPFYVIYCIGNYTFSPYKVIWMEQQNPKKFRAAVISSKQDSITPNKLLIPDHKLYFASLYDENEAHYLCGFLNSRPVRTWLGGFLLGKQIGTTIFEYMKVPKYDPKNDNFIQIAEISKKAHSVRAGTIIKEDLSQTEEENLKILVEKICKNNPQV